MPEASNARSLWQGLIQGPKAAILLAPLLIVWVVWGVCLGGAPVEQADLFWAFTVASLAGAGGMAAVCMRKRSLLSRVGYAALLLLVWRLGYFPILVFSGVVTSGFEWLFFAQGASMTPLYVVFVIWVWLFHSAVAFFLHLATRPAPAEPLKGVRRLLDRRLLLAVVVPNVLVAMAVSVIEPSEDLTLLPDWPHAADAHEVPAVHAPDKNPYLPRVTEEGATVQERILAFNAGITYEIIPPSRWGIAVKGTLEHLTFANYEGSAADRVLEHHLAYLAADRMVREGRSVETEQPRVEDSR